MAQIKISQLPIISTINANTANTLFPAVDVGSDVTGQITAHTLAQGLFSNEILNVGTNAVLLQNTVAQFSNSNPNFIQINLQNFNPNGASDMVITADNGTDLGGFIDLGINNSTWNPAILGQTSQFPYDGYLIVDGPTSTATGNLVIGTANPGTNLVFAVSGHLANNIVAKMTANGLSLNTQSYIVFGDNTVQSTAAASLAYSQAGFAAANTNATNITTIQGVNVTQNTNVSSAQSFANGAFVTANSAASFANSAFTKANNALANTTGTFAGDLTITGNVTVRGTNLSLLNTNLSSVGSMTVNGTMVLANSNFTATESAVTISASPTVATPSNDGYMIHISGKNGVPSRIVSDAYGTGAYSVYASRSARGTIGSPSAVQAGDIMGRFSANGYGTTKWQQFGTGRIDFVATENFTDANTGSQIQFWNCPVGSNTLTNILSLNGDEAIFTGVVNPQKGFVYNPRVPAGNQTAITINYATDSMVKANLVADLTISHSNFLAGKVVEVWLVNTGGTSRTVTHGLTALNSTTNSTTFTIPSTSSAYLRFFSIDGDLANTFVTVSHA
jgi:hypothetical protein